MAFDHVGFFTMIGKTVKMINTVNGYIAATETLKQGIRDAYEAEDLHDLYGAAVPQLVAGFQSSTNAFILSLISQLDSLLLDRDYVTEQLDFYETGRVAVLNALYDYMVDEAETIKTSVVTLGGSDADKKYAEIITLSGENMAGLLCTRTLDGVNNPGNGVTAHLRYLNAESQLARSTTVTGEIISSSTLDSEVVQLYPTAEETNPYLLQDEEPSTGPSLTNARSTRIGLSNADFDTFTADSGNSPDSWAMSGGTAGTAWLQVTGPDAYGDGTLSGLQVKTSGVTLKQQVTSLEANRMYFMFALVGATGDDAGDEGDSVNWVFTLKTNSGTTLKTLGTQTSTCIAANVPYLAANLDVFFAPFTFDDTVNLSDVYLNIVNNTFTGTAWGTIFEVGIVPATYWNGLGWTYVNLQKKIALGSKASMAIANNDAGVFQAFFRKAFNVQLPTADSPTISDSLAT